MMKASVLTVASSLVLIAGTANAAVRLDKPEVISGTLTNVSNPIALAGSHQTTHATRATTLYSAGGFESFNNATLIGQNGFARDSGANTQWNVQGTTGSKFVNASPATATSWAYVPVNYTPAAGELVSASVDIAASDPTLSATDPFGYLLDVYAPAGRIGRVGLIYSNNTILPAVTFNNGGTVGNYLLSSTPLTAGSFYNFEVRADFATKTFSVFSGGSLIAADLAFASLTPATLTSLSDADLQISGAAGAGTAGGFDNYIISTLPVPEPTSMVAIAGLTGLLARRRRNG